jgi:hypothetical protein
MAIIFIMSNKAAGCYKLNGLRDTGTDLHAYTVAVVEVYYSI